MKVMYLSDVIKGIKERADVEYGSVFGTSELFPWNQVSFKSGEFQKEYAERMEAEDLVYAVYDGTYVLLWILKDGTVKLAFERKPLLSLPEKELYDAFTDFSTVQWVKGDKTFEARYLTVEKRNARVVELLFDDPQVTNIKLS